MSIPNRIAVLNSDGTTDTSFAPGAGLDAAGYSVQATPYGTVIAGGAFNMVSGSVQAKLAFFDADGALQESTPTPNNTVRTLALQTDGSVIFGGDFTNVNGSTRNRIARIESDLTLESAYNPNAGGTVYGLFNQEDGKTIAVGAFTTMGGITRNRIARLYNDEAPKTLSVLSVNLIQWLRGGSSPETERVSFELSTNGGTTYADIAGTITRIGGGWQLVPASSLTSDGIIRARAYPTDSHSEGLIEDTVTFDVNPEIEVSQGSTVLVDGVSTVTFDDTQLGSSREVTITITNIGLTHLDLQGATKVHLTTGTQWSVVSQPTSPIEFGESVNFTLRFTPTSAGVKTDTVTIDNNDPNEDPFTFGLSGECLPGPGSVDTSWQVVANGGAVTATHNAIDQTWVGGSFTTINALSRDRFTIVASDGTVQSQTGRVTNGSVLCFCHLPDGKVLIGGTFTTISGVTRNRLARINANGSLDTSFSNGANDDVYSLALQADGSVIVGGFFTTIGGVTRRGLAKLTATGALDTTFVTSAMPQTFSIATQTDGKLLVSGFGVIDGFSTNAFIQRLNVDGGRDTTFNAAANGQVNLATLDASGKVLVAGSYTSIGGATKTGLNRLTATGSHDNTFSELVSLVRSIALQCDGRVIAGSYSAGSLSSTERLVRLTSVGANDTTFVASARNQINGLDLQDDGKLVVAGDFNLAGGTRKYIARLLNDSGSATSSLSVVSETAVQWLRGGTAPETQVVVFHYSQDNGVTWIRLGQGTRITGGWTLTGIALPISGTLRAQAYIPCGYLNGSTSISEEQITFSNLNVGDLVVEYPVGTAIADNSTLSVPGTLPGQTTDAVVTLRNVGNATITSITAQIPGTVSNFSIINAPATSLAANGTTTVVVRFTPPSGSTGVKTATFTIGSSVPGSKNPYTLNLTGNAVGVPTATTGSNSAPATGQRTLNGTFRANHDTASAYFQYRLASSSTWLNSSTTNVTGFTNTAVSTTLTGLTVGQAYEYRAIIYNAVNAAELIKPPAPFIGSILTFTAT